MEKFVKITGIENEVMANFIESVLKDREIPHAMRSYHDSAMNGLYQGPKGWGHIEAPRQYEEEIKSIVSDLSKPVED